jgi:O-succinylbenzoic acid--CoA ligase
MNYITINKNKYSFSSLGYSEIDKKNLTDEEEIAINLIQKWQNGEQNFEFFTSGSTGQPKKIELSRKILTYSALETLRYLKIRSGSALLCISPKFVGGTMVIIRALVGKLHLEIMPASSDFTPVDKHYTLTSMVPLQIENILANYPEKLNQFDHILIGGAPLDPMSEERLLKLKPESKIYVTFGMTETASHVAIRPIGKDFFQTIGDIQIDSDENDRLLLKGSVTDNQWIHTNDVVEIKSVDRFQWIGRADFIINSGGFKVNPEKVEKHLKTHFPNRNIMISGLPDKKLGEKVICIVEGNPFEWDINKIHDGLHRYEMPRKVYFMDRFEQTSSGKIDRLKTINILLNQLSHEP